MNSRTSTTFRLLPALAFVLCLAPFFVNPADGGIEHPTLQNGQSSPATDTRPAKTPHAGMSENRIVRHLETGIAEAAGLLARYGYIILFLAIFVEGFGIPAPGQTLLMAASVDAARGSLSIAWVLVFALLAAIAGNAIGYAVGRWGGHPLFMRLGVQEKRFARIESRFAKSGAGVLLIARFFDGLRQLNGIVAGLLEMPWKKFALWNTLGGMLWTAVWGLGIYFLGRKMHFVHLAFKRIEPLVIILAAVALASLLVYLLTRRRRNRSR